MFPYFIGKSERFLCMEMVDSCATDYFLIFTHHLVFCFRFFFLACLLVCSWFFSHLLHELALGLGLGSESRLGLGLRLGFVITIRCICASTFSRWPWLNRACCSILSFSFSWQFPDPQRAASSTSNKTCQTTSRITGPVMWQWLTMETSHPFINS